MVYVLCGWSGPMPIARMQSGNPIYRGASPVTLRGCNFFLMLSLANNPMTRSSYHYARLIRLMQTSKHTPVHALNESPHSRRPAGARDLFPLTDIPTRAFVVRKQVVGLIMQSPAELTDLSLIKPLGKGPLEPVEMLAPSSCPFGRL